MKRENGRCKQTSTQIRVQPRTESFGALSQGILRTSVLSRVFQQFYSLCERYSYTYMDVYELARARKRALSLSFNTLLHIYFAYFLYVTLVL